jgi:hypothetical protein
MYHSPEGLERIGSDSAPALALCQAPTLKHRPLSFANLIHVDQRWLMLAEEGTRGESGLA